MTVQGPLDRSSAIDDYYQARRRGVIQEILARFTGRPVDLLPFEEVRRRLKAQSFIDRGLQDIPLDAIVGSVNRYQDFTRSFLPRKGVRRDRWAGVELASFLQGLPPIEVYQIGAAYFVKDGNHRVSAARHLNVKRIQAYVEEMVTHVPLTPETTLDEIVLKAEQADFLERTRLTEMYPGAELALTEPGQYPRLLAHISTQTGAIPPEILARWYEQQYLPTVQMIAETGILRDFPGRTVADLYLWTVEHRQALEEEFGQEIQAEAAARHLVDLFSPKTRRIISRLGSRIWRTIVPRKLQGGPPPGRWREERLAATPASAPHQAEGRRLFKDILVAVSGGPDGWAALEQALEIARRETARLNGLHALKTEEDRESSAVQALEAEFIRRCAQAGVPGKMILGVGTPSHRIWEQSRWNDLVVVGLTYPPPPQPFAELGAGFRSLVQCCSRPLLAVPRRVSGLKKALLAYDGSPKAREALYVAAYLAGQWQIGLVVITALESSNLEALTNAWQYLETHEIPATYVKADGPAIQEILITSEEQGCDLLIMGGHSHNRALDMVLGNTVDQVLRVAHKPVLICR